MHDEIYAHEFSGVIDAELRLDVTRDDDLNDLEDGGVKRCQAHTKTARDWPNKPRLAKVSNTRQRRTWPNRPRGQDGDQEMLQWMLIYCAEQ